MAVTKYKSVGQMVKAGDYEALKNFLEAQKPEQLKALEEINNNGMRDIDSLLFYSAEIKAERQLDIMELLIKYGGNPNVADKDEITLLMKSCQSNNVAAVKSILSLEGININKADAGGVYTAMHYAVIGNAPEAFDELVKAGANPHEQHFLTGKTYLHYAAFEGHTEMVDCLITHGVDPHAEDAITHALASEMVQDTEEFQPLYEKIEAYRQASKKDVDAFDFKM